PGEEVTGRGASGVRRQSMNRAALLTGLLLVAGLSLTGLARGQGEAGRVEITVVEGATGRPVPCRVHLKDADGKPQRAPGLPFWRDHFVGPGTFRLELPPGRYDYEVERGPEYNRGSGSFVLKEKAVEALTVKLERLADLAAEGWWSGELHVHRAVEEIELHLRAEDLHVAPVI